MIDLTAAELAIVQRILVAHVPELEVWAYGSRVTGSRKPWSDLDLAIVNHTRLPHALLTAIEWDFEESDLPFKVDVTDLAAVSPEFRARIEAAHECIQPAAKQRAAG